MRVLILTPCELPVPAVKGGAVLTLIESLVIQNEANKRMDLTVVGIHDNEAIEKAKQYVNTKFIFIKSPAVVSTLDTLYEYFFSKILQKPHGVLKLYGFKLYAIRRCKKILKENNYDRVVFQNKGYLLHILKSRSICKKYRGKFYYHIHNDIPDNIYIKGLKQCKLLLVSEYLERKIVNMCGSEIKEQINILRNGFDCTDYERTLSETEKMDIRNTLGITEGKRIVLFAGRIAQTKGIEELIEAFLQLQRSDTVLLVIGAHEFGALRTSPFEQKMKKIFSSLGNQVVFTGYVPYKDMWKYYKIADVAVLPSMWEEPAGLTMIEASAAGTPVITTYAGGIPEYLSEEYVILLKRGPELVSGICHAINDVLNNPEIYKLRGRAASNFVISHYSEKVFLKCL